MHIIIIEVNIIFFAVIWGKVLLDILELTGIVEFDNPANKEKTHTEKDIISLADAMRGKTYRVVWLNSEIENFHINDEIYIAQNASGNIIVKTGENNIALSSDCAQDIKVQIV